MNIDEPHELIGDKKDTIDIFQEDENIDKDEDFDEENNSDFSNNNKKGKKCMRNNLK